MEQTGAVRLTDLIANRAFVLKDVPCRLVRGSMPSAVIGCGSLELMPGKGLNLTAGDICCWFCVDDRAQHDQIEDCLRRFNALAEVTGAVQKGGGFFLHIVFFACKKSMGRIELVLSDVVKRRLQRMGISASEDGISRLERGFILSDGIEDCFAFQYGRYLPQEVQEEETDAPHTDAAADEANSQEYLQLFGKDCTIYARLRGEGPDQHLVAEQVTPPKREPPCMMLGMGSLHFTDEAGFASAIVRRRLEHLPGYLRLWDKYAALEGQFLLDKARNVGVIKYQQNHYDPSGRPVLYVREESRAGLRWIASGDYILFSDGVPEYLQDESLTWEQYCKIKQDTASTIKQRQEQIKIEDVKGTELVLDGQPPVGMVASLSIIGDKKQIDRRENARMMIREGRSAMPGLGLLIEGEANLAGTSREGRIEPLSSRVRECFSNEPTTAQREAVRVGLNTPDIAIIQGPPGTGKTTVITAIIERLNELADKRGSMKGEILVTSMQHDAVRNVIDRLSVNGLPTVKFGAKKDADDSDFDGNIQRWCEALTKRLREKYTTLQEPAMQELSRLMTFYAAFPDNKRALALLQCAQKNNADSDVAERIKDVLKELHSESSENVRLLSAIRRLRCTRESFEDDGAWNAQMLYDQLAGGDSAPAGEIGDILEVLKQAACSDTPTDELLRSLQDVRQNLLDRATPPPYYKKDSVRSDIVDIYNSVKAQAHAPEDPEEQIVAELLRQVEYSPWDVEEAIRDYSFVFGATLQQSMLKQLRLVKETSRGDMPSYDTVIIDEAARATPGDLMITMAQARKRIILVGDHRQLPHIYDEDIFDELKRSGDMVRESDMKDSLFQHLWDKLRELEKTDHIRRTVTLDKQFRMHPLLGKFISDNFYREYGEQFDSPLGPELFRQNIFREPIKWIHLGAEKGQERRESSGSRFRECEAECIAKMVRKYMEQPENSGLRFGVISFYSAQVRQIRKKLDDLLGDRLQVGSVDAFQGKEFDVIFLSVVRTLDSGRAVLSNIDPDRLEQAEEREYREQVGRKIYGFLTSPNRLCVALSRQMKLLIVVGDKNMFFGGAADRIAKVCVPAMRNLYQLCAERGAVEDG